MNEEVAKTRVCPIFEVGSILGMFGILYATIQGHDISKDLMHEMQAARNCKGSTCMMWRRAMPGYGGYCGLGGNISNE